MTASRPVNVTRAAYARDIVATLLKAGRRDLAQAVVRRFRHHGTEQLPNKQADVTSYTPPRRPLFGALLLLNIELGSRTGELKKLIGDTRESDKVYQDWHKIVKAWQSPKGTYPSPARMKKFQQLVREATDASTKYTGYRADDFDRWWSRESVDQKMAGDRKQLRDQKKKQQKNT